MVLLVEVGGAGVFDAHIDYAGDAEACQFGDVGTPGHSTQNELWFDEVPPIAAF